ncbi:sensor histidine kinase [Leeia oryzae]|uniref:sensor histidine kinase n=1 Tax=Leeia oryzae TaxID=356662 RepID=UPI00037DB0B5|nr:sensor histidine kinase KdpD [Leeia oryzae]
MQDDRLSPDELLEEIQRQEQESQRGRLKIFFGACAGVGKTYAMLSAARQKREEGLDVVVGVVETHGRQETESQLIGLDILPRKDILYKDNLLTEFDLDAALARKPALILVDELAHSNIPGSRHPKRWQDVEELLAAGIDVYSTLNVQHLESLNDIVGQITGIVVRETLPDRVFDQAADITLVDIPPDELLARLSEGKVYMPRQAERASKHFFRKGNLLALRELALRRTADRVDAQMRAYRADQSIHPIWQARERLLVCVGLHAAEKLIRNASRLAASLKADWIVAYVETPQLLNLPAEQRNHMLKMLKLAQTLGAETSVLAGTSLPATLLAYARSRNVSRMVVGKSHQPVWRQRWQPSLADQLSQQASDVDVFVVAHDAFEPSPAKPGEPAAASLLFETTDTPKQLKGYLFAALGCGLTTLLTAGLLQYFDLANVVMIFLLIVVLIAIRYGRGPGIFASVTSVMAFDFFFVPPRLSFTVSDTQYLLTFTVMLIVAILISQLAAKLRFEANIATYRERRTSALYELGQALGGALTTSQIIDIASQQLGPLFQSKILFYLPDSQDRLMLVDHEQEPVDAGVAQWVFDHQEMAGLGTNTLPANSYLFLPLKAPMRTRGVLAIRPRQIHLIYAPEQQRLLDTCAAQIALALERVHYVEVAQDAIVAMESERLRNSVLSTVSHDLRTPLTSLVGLASLMESDHLPPAERKETASLIKAESLRMNNIVTNLLDMARLQSGVHLHKEWLMIEEVIGSAIRETQRSLAQHQVRLEIAPGLPVVEIDAVLIERVLVNLLENAAKYTPPGSEVRLSAHVALSMLVISVSDNGPGLPEGLGNKIFEKFTRGVNESSTAGVGLGLAICKSIIEAHQGRIQAENIQPHGAKFSFTLPVSATPVLPE